MGLREAYARATTAEEQYAVMEDMVLQNTVQAMEALYHNRIAPLEHLGHEVKTDMVEAKLSKQTHGDFDRHKSDVGKFLKENPQVLHTMTRDIALEYAYLKVKDSKAPEAVQKAKQSGRNDVLKEMSNVQTIASGQKAGGASKVFQMTNAQKAMAERAGLSLDEYSKYMK
jgi:hypothetical protein